MLSGIRVGGFGRLAGNRAAKSGTPFSSFQREANCFLPAGFVRGWSPEAKPLARVPEGRAGPRTSFLRNAKDTAIHSDFGLKTFC